MKREIVNPSRQKCTFVDEYTDKIEEKKSRKCKVWRDTEEKKDRNKKWANAKRMKEKESEREKRREKDKYTKKTSKKKLNQKQIYRINIYWVILTWHKALFTEYSVNGCTIV